MKNFKISLCHHPTTVVFVDDNKDYLAQLEFRFNELLPVRAFDDPVAALQYLNLAYQEENFTNRCTLTSTAGEGTYNHIVSDINLKLIQNEILRPERFSEVAVVVVDYTMPGMNGIEFCHQIKNPNILIILLTGEADNDLAVREFNNGTIDRFIKKTTPNIKDILHEEILKLEQQYFIQLSNILTNHATPSNLKCLEDKEVAKQFYHLCASQNILEYYLLSETGDFILLDNQGSTSYLTIKSDEEIMDLYDYAEISGASNELLTALQTRNMLPLLYHDPDPKDWHDYLSPAYPIIGEKKYYYSFKKQVTLPLPKILSYEEYLSSV